MPLCAVRKPCPVAISMCNHPSSSKPQILPKRFNLFSPTGTETFELVLETICLAGQERSCTILDCFTRLSEERVAFFWPCGDSKCLAYTLPFHLQPIHTNTTCSAWTYQRFRAAWERRWQVSQEPNSRASSSRAESFRIKWTLPWRLMKNEWLKSDKIGII